VTEFYSLEKIGTSGWI